MAWHDNLDPQSSAFGIASSQHARIRVLAGPGTGKSFAMKRRVARLLEADNVQPRQILAVTFTRVAAEDLHRELVSLGVPGADDLEGRTLHSLAMRILMRNHVLAVLGRTPRPLNEYELEPLLADLGSHHGDKYERERLIKAYGAGWARLQTQQPGFARTAAEQAFVDDLVSWLTFHDAMLMDEVIPHLHQYLSGNPGAPELTEYAHILVDEYQDLNRAEQDSVELLGRAGSVCIIGDDDQSIYSFRHAHPDGIRQWVNLQPAEEHAIADCFRCPTTVVRMANTVIARNTHRLGTMMNERAANGLGNIAVRQYGTAELETEAIAQKIVSLIGDGVHPREIIVLAQRRTFATPIFLRLRERGIPTKSYYAETELNTEAAQERFALLKLFLNHDDKVALRWLLGRAHSTWHNKQYKRITGHVEQNGGTPWSVLCDLADGRLALRHTGTLVSRFNEIRQEVARMERHQDLDDFIENWLPENPETVLLRETVNACREGAETPKDLFDAVYEAISQPEIPMEVEEVRVMSLHKSKGLSAHYVFIVGCVEGLLPASPVAGTTRQEQLAKLEEDRRLFYVGITRVKSSLPNRPGYLALSYAQTMDAAEAFKSQITPVRTRRGVAALQPSRFFAEMAPHCPAPRFNTPL